MNFKKKLLSIFFINILIPVSLFSQIAFLSFENKSSYKGNWNLSYDLPDFISDYLREKYTSIILSPSTTENLIKENSEISYQEFLTNKGIKYLIEGIILNFSINRSIAGEPKVAQYESYSNNIEVEFKITDLRTNKIIFQQSLEQKTSDLGVGLTIFGRETETKKEFEQLEKIKFGSDEFLKTLVGKNLLKLCEKFSSKVETIIELQQNFNQTEKKLDTTNSKLKRKILTGEILFVDDDTKEVFVNLGKKENLQVGMILPVFASGDSIFDKTTGEFLGVTDKKIGEIEIIEVRGDRFSLGIIKNEKEKISKGNKVRKVEISSE
ncbi:MAG: hypothetical protein N3F03_08925 [Ignavibacteria bacterium]|nr:hypothetical protein [Ignavibacteria bacterium]